MDVPADWWRTFFSGIPVETWLRAATPEMTVPEVDFLQNVLHVEPPARLLDVPCGGGRHALALAGRGFRVTGVDLSTDFLTAARTAGQGTELLTTWEQRDMRDLPWHHEFDGAYCFGNSFGYLDDTGNADFLKAVGRALKTGARFVLDTGACAESVLPALQPRRWYPFGDIYFLAQVEYNHALGRMDIEYIHIRDGRVDARRGFQRCYTYRQISDLLAEAGFGGVEGYGGTGGEPYRLSSPRLLLVATKKA